MRVFDDILDALSDGKWHEVYGESESKTERILLILEKYGFAELERRRESTFGPLVTKRAKLSKKMFNFLKKIKKIENEEVGHSLPVAERVVTEFETKEEAKK